MSEDELLAKFRDCLEFGLGATKADADRLADAIMNPETVGDAAKSIVSAFPQPKYPPRPGSVSESAAAYCTFMPVAAMTSAQRFDSARM